MEIRPFTIKKKAFNILVWKLKSLVQYTKMFKLSKSYVEMSNKSAEINAFFLRSESPPSSVNGGNLQPCLSL